MVGKPADSSQSEDNSEDYEGNTASYPRFAAAGNGGRWDGRCTNMRTCPIVSSTQTGQMGCGCFPHPHEAGRSLSIHDPGPLRQQHDCLQGRYAANCKSCPGYHPACHEAGKKEGRRRVTAPRRSGGSIHFRGVFNLTKAYGITPSMSRRGTARTMPWRKTSSPFSRRSVLPAQARILRRGKAHDQRLYFLLQS